ncbi:uncharacterized protein N7482_002074 [Penicillium canariense]|uniref:Dickkopf N-terminal cysteine-rich domain-containing protein n=1 Tax=Penicillium canariense TaxID=189055 RepID=A0A9W9IGW0_9EURO|nr:uncharacterized protein N7482_002074 [Penicillium canariense]KAJ5176197.1 hypothetical protein N7482_002074 [Penicillium canariense]
MHASVVSLLVLLSSAALALPNPELDISAIPSEVLYYYRFHQIPLSVYTYTDGLTLDLLHGHHNKVAVDMTCGPSYPGICPSVQWYCDRDMSKCRGKEVIGMTCNSDEACYSGICGPNNMCLRPKGQFGSTCTDHSQCASGLVCRYGKYNRDHLECLDKGNKLYGSSCTNNRDCEHPFICNEMTVGGGENICSLPEDLTGSSACIGDGELCGSNGQCCSGKCQMKGIMPLCAA